MFPLKSHFLFKNSGSSCPKTLNASNSCKASSFTKSIHLDTQFLCLRVCFLLGLSCFMQTHLPGKGPEGGKNSARNRTHHASGHRSSPLERPKPNPFPQLNFTGPLIPSELKLQFYPKSQVLGTSEASPSRPANNISPDPPPIPHPASRRLKLPGAGARGSSLRATDKESPVVYTVHGRTVFPQKRGGLPQMIQ